MKLGRLVLVLCGFLLSPLVYSSVADSPHENLSERLEMLANNNPEAFEKVLTQCQESDFQTENLRMCSIAYSYEHHKQQGSDLSSGEKADE